MKLETLKDALSDWNDIDGATWAVAICFGLMTPETSYQMDAKHVFESRNPIGDMLRDIVVRLVAEGVLEQVEINDDECYRWNPSFKGSWEIACENRMRSQQS